MSNIDNRIVEMQFNNKQFENGVQDTLKSLNKLEKGLNLDGATKSLENLEKTAAKGIPLTSIANGLSGVTDSFSALGVVGITVLSNLTTAAMNAGTQLVKSLTVDNISAGFSKYEQKTTAVQTILNSTGQSMEYVTEQLDKLNWFTDETSYNFIDMVDNIGKFTSAGIDLDVAVTAMQGIANWAALSGQGTNEASRAMYNLAQAIGVGSVKLMDWRSIENANMGTKEFKETVIDTAKALGTLPQNGIIKLGKEMVEVTSSRFSDTLSEGWFTSDVLLKSLDKYGNYATEVFKVSSEQGLTAAEAMKLVSTETMELGAKAFKAAQEAKTFTDAINATKDAVSTGWMTTFEIIFGDYYEAKELWTDLANTLYDVFAASAEARNEMLSGWKENGGRDSLLRSIVNIFNAVSAIAAPIKEAFSNIFPPMTSQRLLNITKAFERFTKNLMPVGKTVYNLRRTFEGFFSLLQIGWSAIKAIAGGIKGILNYLNLGGGFLQLTGDIGAYITSLKDAVIDTDWFETKIEQLGEFLLPIAEGFKSFAGNVVDAFKKIKDIDTSGIDNFFDKAKARLAPLKQIGTVFSKVFSSIFTIIEKVAPVFFTIGRIIGKALDNIKTKILDSLDSLSFDGLFDLANGGLFITIAAGIKSFIDKIGAIADKGSGFLSGLTGVLDGVKGSLEAWQSSIKADTLLKIAGAVAILVAALVILSMVDSEKLTTSLAAITVLFADLFGSMAIFQQLMDGKSLRGMSKMVVTLLSLSIAIGIMSIVLKSLAKLEWEEISKGLMAITGISAVLVASALALSTSSGKLIKGATGIVIFTAAILILAQTVKQLGAMDTEALTRGLVGVGILLTEIALFLTVTDLDGMGVLKGTGLILLATSIRILVKAVSKFAEMDTDKLIQGLAAVGAVLAELSLFINLTGDAKRTILTATGMVILGAAMLIFTEAIKRMGDLDPEKLGQGLGVLAGSLAVIAVAMNAMPKGMISKATGITILAAALLILKEVLYDLGQMSTEEIANALLAVGGALASIAVAVSAMKGSKALSSATAILVITGAMAAMVPILKAFGTMPLDEIAIGLGALAGMFIIFGLAGLALAPVTGTLLALGGAIILFGVGIAAIGGGMLAFSLGLSALAVSGSAGAAALTLLVTSIIGLIPLIIKQVGVAIIELAKVITDGAPAIGEAFVAIVVAIVQALVAAIPEIVTGFFQILDAVLETLVEYTPKITDQLFSIILGFFDVVSQRMPELVEKGSELIGSFLTAVIDKMGKLDVKSLALAIGAIAALVVIFKVLAGAASSVKKALITAGGMALVLGVMAAIFLVLATIDAEKMLAIGVSLSAVMLSLAGTMAIISMVPISGALTGIAGLAIVIAGITAIITALGAIAQIPGFSWLMEEGTKVLEQIGTAIGSFVGHIVSGFMTGISGGFPQIGTDLADFMTNAQPFFDGAAKVDASTMEGIKSLASAVLMLTAADILDGLTSWLTGGSSIVEFGKELAEFGPYFMDYYNSIAGIDGSVVTASANAAKSLAEFAENIPNSGGLIAKFTGENSLAVFAEELAVFGPSLKSYADSVTGLDAGVVENSANAAKALAEMASNLPNSGGLVGWFAGENDMGYFGEQLMLFGPALMSYSESVKGLDANVVTNSANAAKALSELAANLPNTGGLVSWFTGDNDIADFGDSLAEFGGALSEYYLSIAEIDFNKMASVTTQLNRVATLASTLEDVDSWGMVTFAENLAYMGQYGVSSYIAAFDDLEESTNTAGTNLATAITEPMYTYFDGQKDTMETKGATLIGAFIASIQEVLESSVVALKSAGSLLVDGLISGIKTKQPSSTAAFSLVAASGILTISSYYLSYYNTGGYLIDGFANGITNNASKAISAAGTVASKSLAAAKQALDINSPSGEFKWLGEMADEGLVGGLLGLISKVIKAGKAVGNSAISSVRNTLNNLASVITDDMQVDPVIRPVVDLSNVTNSVGAIDGLFNDPTMSLAGRNALLMNRDMAGLQALENQQSNISGNLDVVEAVNNLGDRLDGLQTAISEMQINMDGQQVGRVVIPYVDRGLGQKAAQKGRGN